MLIRCPECSREVSDVAPSCPGCGYVLKAAAAVPAPSVGPSVEAQMLVEQRVTNEGPSAGVAYLLWFFLGLLGVHRFYLGKAGSGVLMLVLTITVAGLFITCVWWLIDALLIPDMLREKRSLLRGQMLAIAGGAQANPYANLPTYHDPALAKP